MRHLSNAALVEALSKAIQGLAPFDYHADEHTITIKEELFRRLKSYSLQCEKDRKDPLRPDPPGEHTPATRRGGCPH